MAREKVYESVDEFLETDLMEDMELEGLLVESTYGAFIDNLADLDPLHFEEEAGII